MITGKYGFMRKYYRLFCILLISVMALAGFAVPQFAAGAPLSSLDIELSDYDAVTGMQPVQLFWKSIVNDLNCYYRVERKKDSEGFVIYRDYCGPANLYKLGDLVSTTDVIEQGHVYTYRVSYFYTSAPASATIFTDEVTVSTTVVKAPVSLMITPVSPERIDLQWSYKDSASNNTVIERKTGVDGAWTELAAVEPGILTYSDIGLSNGAVYFYRVKAKLYPHIYSRVYPDVGNETGKYTRLAAPDMLSGYAVSPTRILLTWYECPYAGSYIIERKGESDSDFLPVYTAAAHTTQWTDTGLTPDAWYTYRIKSISATSTSEYSPEAVIACVFVEKPTNLTAQAISQSRVELSWTDNSNNETGYEIWKKTGQKGEWLKYAHVYRNDSKFIDLDVSADTSYYYKVRGRISESNACSDFSNEACAWTVTIAPPSDVQYSVFSVNIMKLVWKDNSNNESGFVVERMTGIDGEWTEIARLPANTTVYYGSSPTPGIRYLYRLKAYDSTNINAVSYSEKVTVAASIPQPPSDLILEAVSSSQVKLSWTDNSDNEEGFKIERKLITNSKYLEVAVTGAGVNTYTDGNLSHTGYYYRVTAFNNLGKSACSNEEFITTREPVTYNDISNLAWARAGIENQASRGVFPPAADGKFHPNDKITRGEFISILVKAFKMKGVAAGSFADVSPKYKYYNEIMTASKYGIIAGSRGSYVYPGRIVTRQETAVLLARTLNAAGRALEYHDISILDEYSDRDLISDYALSSLASLCGEGFMSGKNSTGEKWLLAPKDGMTRAEAAVLVYRVIDG